LLQRCLLKPSCSVASVRPCLKAAGVKDLLYTYPPLSAMHCLGSEKERVLFAQAQNSVRNAMLDHALANGHEWAIPLAGGLTITKPVPVLSSSLCLT